MNKTQSAAILTIGTEITTGEIANSNAAWISRQLVDQGYTIALHISVADDRDAIQKALESCTEHASLVMITGGLGPTSDDFTREEIAKFIQRPLKWDEPAWQHIVNRLNSLSVPIAESNKQQCWFPEGAEVLANREGTAAGFYFQDKKRPFELFVLPGPPREISAIWNDHVQSKLNSRIPIEKRTVLKRWITMGMSESKIGELVEEALKDSGFTTGYRSRMPYIDIKIWIPFQAISEFDLKWKPRLESSIEKWVVGHDADDVAFNIWEACPPATPIYIIDRVTCGQLAARLYEQKIPPGKQLTILTCDYSTPIPPMPASCDVITITANFDLGTWRIGLTGTSDHKDFSENSRYKGEVHAERFKKYVCEKSMHMLVSWWSG